MCVLKQENANNQRGIFTFYRVERIVVTTSNSSELNDTGDRAVDSLQQEAEETIPESSTSRYGWKRTRVIRETIYVPWRNIHVEM